MRTPILVSLLILLLASACQSQTLNPYPSVGAVPLPSGYHRLPADNRSFAAWLRAVRLKADLTVYLYNGKPKAWQGAQFAVLDISVGHADLQQCADAVMRLRAEYCYASQQRQHICFYTEQAQRLSFAEWARHRPDSTSRASFDAYLAKVFMYCSTRTLEKQLLPKPLDKVNPGDVLIKGGAPGHAMIVMDAAEDAGGHRIYLLAQSYMPAQDIHIVKNPANAQLSPWYATDATNTIETPEWTFTINQLKNWPEK